MFPLLYWLCGGKPGINTLLVISYALCTLSAFLLHRFVTFRSRGASHIEGARFLVLTGIIFALNLALLNATLPFFPAHPIILQTIIIVCLQIGNYAGLNRLVFPLREKKRS
jgi:putative flippase GtrA